MWRFGPNDATSCVIIDILFFHCSFVDMLNIISTCRDIICVDINVDKRCVDHSTKCDDEACDYLCKGILNLGCTVEVAIHSSLLYSMVQ